MKMAWCFFALSLLLQACSLLPASGPSASTMRDAIAQSDDFAFIQITRQNIDHFGPAPVPHIKQSLIVGFGQPQARNIDVNDRIRVTIWEASPDGLFATQDVKQSAIEVQVDQSRSIFVPYAGRISVAGLDSEALRIAITDKLTGKAIDPQVQVTLIDQTHQFITVIVDVSTPGQFQVPPNGLRLIEAIAQAGGPRQASHETKVSIVRGATHDTLQMDAILQHTQNNIWLRPRDVIEVSHFPRTFTAFGAVSSQNLQPLTAESVSLAEALAQSGGLNDRQADISAVFLFRHVQQAKLTEVGIPVPDKGTSVGIPTIFRIDLADPHTLFLTSAFTMRDNDIIYVANAAGTDLEKLSGLIIGPFLSSTQTIDAVAN